MKVAKITVTPPAARLLRRVKLELAELTDSEVTLADALTQACEHWLDAYHVLPPGSMKIRTPGQGGNDD